MCQPSPGNSICQGFMLEKNLMPVTFVANNVMQDHINIHTGENHMCVKFGVLFKLKGHAGYKR